MNEQDTTTQDETPEGVATPAENAALSHTDESAPGTTRDGGVDAGVPMLAGSSDEPVGPEDALGIGAKRGDYSTRVGDNHAESIALPDGGEPIRDAEGNVVDYKPAFALQDQGARVADVGDAEGLKGGVDTAAV